ncbi:hypothetical protein phiHau3_53 [Streptomyces phage phiHau3]|uniref:Uncharacterized protein n=1 Tax=Streptomyces phage phiHau3 TaxID=1204524 RepID=K4I2H7_9CAUD|nr:hypothetical protein phiHau3_53 [Streptomyces phage phiHau3]AFU62030.1 hypothetical protein phiHau3_53 [Streptomyces phage phiHau3]
MSTHRRRKVKGRVKTSAGAASMALTMGWLAFVGIRGPIDGHTHHPGVALNEADDDPPANQRDDLPHGKGVPDGWGTAPLPDQATQTAAPAPSAGRTANEPSTAMGGEQPVTQGLEEIVAQPSPAPSRPSGSAAKGRKAAEGDAPTIVTPEPEQEPASTPQADTEYTVSTIEEDAVVSTLSTEEEGGEGGFSVMDELAHLGSHLRPFSLRMAPMRPLDAPQPDVFVPFGEPVEPAPLREVGQTPQPERFEQLQPKMLPVAPIEVTTLPEAFAL